MQRSRIKDAKDKIGEEISLSGWVDVRRDHGKLIFLDLRDASGKIQMVALPSHADAHKIAGTLRSEWVIEVTGKVNARPERMVNVNEANGKIELEILTIKILNEAETPPFDVRGDGRDIGEDVRLKYRYLDLRRPRLQQNVRMRDKIITFFREYMHANDFVEIETPIMMKGTPEGSREYVVPSRLENGKFYVLPQSPQQFKQLSMVAGFEKYFQIARCFRDEDTRGDRKPEFTQLDLEMSFVDREDVMRLNEELLIELVKTHAPKKKIQEIPFPRLSHAEAVEKYGTDRPDLRADKNDPNLIAFCWIIAFPFFEKNNDDSWTFTHNPFSAAKPEYAADLLEHKNIERILTTQYDVVLNGSEIGGGSIRNHTA